MVKKNFNKKVGKSLLMSALLAGTIMVPMANAKAAETPEIKYSVHVEDHAWMKEVSSKDQTIFAGTKGEARRLEAMKVQLEGLENVTLRFKVHIEDYGDRDFTENSNVIGTTGEAKRLEGITVYADGLEETGYKLQYRVHIENEGDQDWKNVGEFAGSRGKAQRLESIQFRLISAAEEKLQVAKNDALKQLSNEYKASDYTINAKSFEEAMTAGLKAINEAEDIAGVTSALKDAQTNLAKIKSDKTELAGLETKKNTTATAFVAELAEMAAKADSAPAIKAAIENTRRAGTSLIDNATSNDAVDTAKTTALENAVKAAKSAAQKELDELYKTGKKAEDGTISYLTEAAYKTATTALKDETDVAKIVKAYTDAIVEANVVELDDIRTEASDALTAIETAVGKTMFADMESIKDAITAGDKAIQSAETRDAIARAEKNATDTILRLARTNATSELEKLYNGGKAVDCKMLSRTDYNTASKAIANAEDVTAIDAAYKAAKAATKEVAGAQDAIDALEAINAKSDITAIIKEAKSIISQATTASRIAAAKEDAEAKILASEKAYYVAEVNKVVGKIDTENNLYYRTDICNEVKADINNAAEFSELATIYGQLSTKAAEAFAEK